MTGAIKQLGWMAALWAGPVLACPVCGQTSPESQGAYLAMTAMMTLLPLSLIGGLALWVRAKLKGEGDGRPR